MANVTEEDLYLAVCQNDARYDGRFYFGVSSTGIFCYPSCPSRKPRRDHFRVFRTRDEALASGFRPCKRCRSDLDGGRRRYEADLIAQVKAAVAAHPESATVAGLAEQAGISSAHLARLFRQAEGGALHAHILRQRVVLAARLLEIEGAAVLEAGLAAGFESTSSFYAAFTRIMGRPPGEYRQRPATPERKESSHD